MEKKYFETLLPIDNSITHLVGLLDKLNKTFVFNSDDLSLILFTDLASGNLSSNGKTNDEINCTQLAAEYYASQLWFWFVYFGDMFRADEKASMERNIYLTGCIDAKMMAGGY